MKVVIIFYSTTGNTKHVAHLIGSEIVKKISGCEIAYVDGIDVIKALGLGRKDEKIIISSPKPKILSDLEILISGCDVLGVGSFAYCWAPGPGFCEIFDEKILPTKLFVNVKKFFAFTTFGWKYGRTPEILATTVYNKCPQAAFVGLTNIHTPENVVFLLPEKPYRDKWSPEEIEKAKNFGEEISKLIIKENKDIPPFISSTPPQDAVGTQVTPSPVLVPTFFPIKFAYTDIHKILGAVTKIDTDLCDKCGLCVEVCPYGAVTYDSSNKGEVVKDYPVLITDSCWGCDRCYNICPKECIAITNAPPNRSRHPAPYLDPITGLSPEDDKDGVIIGLPLPDGDVLSLRRNKK